jgi:hypothetical protein
MLIERQASHLNPFKENIMSALLKYEVSEVEVPAVEKDEKTGGWIAVPIAPEEHAAAKVRRESTAKNIALFLAAPFIGLAYLVAMPFVALGTIAWLGGKALVEKVPAIKSVALAIAAPFIGLAYIVAMPFVGLGALAWIGMKALANR